jgi:hypothetical protein
MSQAGGVQPLIENLWVGAGLEWLTLTNSYDALKGCAFRTFSRSGKSARYRIELETKSHRSTEVANRRHSILAVGFPRTESVHIHRNSELLISTADQHAVDWTYIAVVASPPDGDMAQ